MTFNVRAGALVVSVVSLLISGCFVGGVAKLQADGRHNSRVEEADAALAKAQVKSNVVAAKFKKDRKGLREHLCFAEPEHVCDEKLSKAFVARLRQAYSLANWKSLSEWCTGNPIECDSKNRLETKVRLNHNAVAQKLRDKVVKASEQQRNQEYRVAEQNALRALHNAGQ